MAKRKNNGLYAYLETSGVLATRNSEDIAAAKKSYWREYKAQWKREKRTHGRSFTISFAEEELNAIDAAAKSHKRSPTRYIREAALAYGANRFVVPDTAAVGAIQELLVQVYTMLDQLQQDHDVESVTGISLMQYMVHIEKTVLAAITQPKLIDNLKT